MKNEKVKTKRFAPLFGATVSQLAADKGLVLEDVAPLNITLHP